MKKIINCIGGFVILNIAMIVLLACSYLVPQKAVYKNLEESLEIIKSEGLYYNSINFDGTFFYDNYTDLLILSTVLVKPEENIFQSAIDNNVSKLGIEQYIPLEGLEELLVDGSQYAEYPNYWVFLVAPLKILFTIFNVGEIRLLFLVAGLILDGIIIYQLNKKINIFAAVGFGVMLVGGGLITNIMCLAYSTDIFLCMLGILFVLLTYEKDKEWLFSNEKIVFFFLGMFCFMFNYWSMPILTLCGPLIVLIMLRSVKENESDCNIKAIICNSFFWGVGLCMEVGVKILTTMIFGKGDTIIEHLHWYMVSGKVGEQKSLLESFNLPERVWTAYLSLAKYFTWINRVIFVVVMICLCVCLFRGGKRIFNRGNILRMLEFFVIGLIPLLWIALMYGHAFHGFDRLQICMSSFAVTSAFAVCINNQGLEIKEEI